MPSFALVPADKMPADALFPEQYEASKRTITKDFLFFGVAIAGSLILAAMVNVAIA